MADPSVSDPPNPNLTTTDEFDPLPIPPLDPTIFSDTFISDLDLDFTFDDLYLPSDTEDFLNFIPPDPCPTTDHLPSDPTPNSDFEQLSSSSDHSSRVSDVDKFLNVDNNPTSSQGSGNYPSPDSENCARSAASSPKKIKLEELGINSLLSKRKKEDSNSESRTSKYRRSNAVDELNSTITGEEDEKRRARLMRNRESAQLSRQRKKHYVEELEDKVRAMHSTIQDLNSKITYMMAENASLRQQLSGGGSVCPPVGMYPHPPMAPMGYPWMPCPPYVVKPQGSQVPLVPIPRLKPQQQPVVSKVRKGEKKSEGKTKKVASVSFLGLLFFVLLFGGLVPMVNVKFGGIRGSDYLGANSEKYSGRIVAVKGNLNGSAGSGDFVPPGNSSEPLVVSLYVPRNDKLVKIDGNLIIHSVLASEKAKSSAQGRGVDGKETSLAVAGNMAPAIPLAGRNNARHPHMYQGPSERKKALGSGSTDKDNFADGKLQQWFQEGLAGPMLSSGMCTEVFQFDVSPSAGAIVPATSVMNGRPNATTQIVKGRNRRILHGAAIPLAGSRINITKEHVGTNPEKDNFQGNSSLSSMVVSVLVDPREAGDGDAGDGVMGPKSLSRIFVVVLIDSVKYVTYSCMLPLKGSSALV